LLRTAGEAPRILVEIQCGYPYESTTLYLSTEDLKIQTYEFKGYVQSFGSISFAVSETEFLASASGFSFSLMRNSDTEKLLGIYQKVKSVIVRQWFKGLANYSSAVILGTFIVDSLSEISLSSFSVNCISDETKLARDVPSEVLMKDYYPQLPNENDNVMFPCVLGKMWFPYFGETKYKYLSTYLLDVAPAYCIDPFSYKYLVYRADQDAIDVNSNPERAYQYLSSPALYTTLPNYTMEHDITNKQWFIKLKSPDATNQGNLRRIRLLPNKAGWGWYNTCLDWWNARDIDPNTYATINSSQKRLNLEFDAMEGFGNYKPDWSSWYARLRAGCVVAATGLLKMKLILWFITEVYERSLQWNLAGGKMELELPLGVSTQYDTINPMSLGWHKVSVEIRHLEGAPLRIYALYLLMDYWDDSYKEQ
jgi:hypothetical protein